MAPTCPVFLGHGCAACRFALLVGFVRVVGRLSAGEATATGGGVVPCFRDRRSGRTSVNLVESIPQSRPARCANDELLNPSQPICAQMPLCLLSQGTAHLP